MKAKSKYELHKEKNYSNRTREINYNLAMPKFHAVFYFTEEIYLDRLTFRFQLLLNRPIRTSILASIDFILPH